MDRWRNALRWLIFLAALLGVTLFIFGGGDVQLYAARLLSYWVVFVLGAFAAQVL